MKFFRAEYLPFFTLPFFLSAAFFPSAVAQPSKDNFQLVWSDEFEVNGLPNAANWGYEEGCSVRNSELQYYAKARIENTHIENGMLTIEARHEKTGNCNYTSANLVSSGKRSVKYGLFEMRAKIDISAGSWPAWWWLPTSGGWPRGGEIDMMEFYKGKTLFNVMDGNQKWYSKTKTVDTAWAGQFHVWTWVWDSLKIDLWLDSTLMNHFNVADADGTGPNGENPFRRPGYMLVNQAIGGNNGGDPSGTSFPVKYIVDYIRHYVNVAGTFAFNGKRVPHPCAGPVQQPPFTVKVYSIDGRLIDNWLVDAGTLPLRLVSVLNRAGRCETKGSGKIRIVVIDDAGGHQVRFAAVPQ